MPYRDTSCPRSSDMWFPRLVAPALLGALATAALPFETAQLTEDDIGTSSLLAFGDASRAPPPRPSCRAFPGSDDWPTRREWQRLNTTLQGLLLRPDPPAAVCYEGEAHDEDACRELVLSAGDTHFYIDDPLSVLAQWPQGSTCLPTLDPAGNCTRGGFPEYVVNATRVADVQVAVNFARNKNVRLVIKLSWPAAIPPQRSPSLPSTLFHSYSLFSSNLLRIRSSARQD